MDLASASPGSTSSVWSNTFIGAREHDVRGRRNAFLSARSPQYHLPQTMTGTKGERTGIRGRLKGPDLSKGSFAYNLSFVSARNAVTLLTQLVFTPIIMHLYTPVAYGTMGAVLSLAIFCSPFATMQYDRAMLMVRDESDLQGLRGLSNLLPLVFSSVLALVLLIGGDRLLMAINLPALGPIVLLAPAIILLSAWAQTSQQMVAARMHYKQSFIFGSINAVGTKLVAVAHGLWVGSGALGLLAAEFFSRTAQLVANSRFILQDRKRWTTAPVSWNELKRVARKYKGFPKFELPGAALSVVSNQVPLWWIPSTYTLAAFGQFSLAIALLEMPMRLLGNSLSAIFYQKAAHTHDDHGAQAMARLTKRLMRMLALAALLPMLLIAFSVEPLFDLLFDGRWALAATMTKSLCILYYFRLIAEPVESVFRVVDRQRTYLFIHGMFLVLRIGTVLFTMAQGYDVVRAITFYACANAVGYLAQTGLILHLMKGLERSAPPGPAA